MAHFSLSAMFPSSSNANMRNVRIINSVLFRDSFHGITFLAFFSNLLNFFFRKPCVSSLFATSCVMSAPGKHIPRVVFVGANIKVLWAKAGRVITSMEDTQRRRDIESKKKISTYSMHRISTFFCVLKAISLALGFSCPYPARSFQSWVFHYIPKFRQMIFQLIASIKRKIGMLAIHWISMIKIPFIMLPAKAFRSIFAYTAIYFTQPDSKLISRFHAQTIGLCGEIRKVLLPFRCYS